MRKLVEKEQLGDGTSLLCSTLHSPNNHSPLTEFRSLLLHTRVPSSSLSLARYSMASGLTLEGEPLEAMQLSIRATTIKITIKTIH